jgi:hypothetical protein
MTEKENLTEKLQVLLSKSDLRALNIIIARRSLERGTKPPPISSYIRELIKKEIDENIVDQVSFAGEKAREIITNYQKQQKPQKTKN